MFKNSLKINNTIPNSFKKQYIYELEIIFKNNEVKNFYKIDNNKSIEIISEDINIKFNLVKEFRFSVTIIDNIPIKYKLNNKIDTNNNDNTFKSLNLYIEFNNINGKLNSNCYVIESDHSLFLTPPNY